MTDKPSDSDPTDREIDHQFPESFSAGIDVEVFGISDPGHVRTNNEDHFLVARVSRTLETLFSNLPENSPGPKFDEVAYSMIVADGVGGQPSGEIASSRAIFTLLNLALHTPDWQFRWGFKEMNLVMWRAQDRFRRVNAALLEEASQYSSRDGMCTTMTAALLHGRDLIISHVGDSRACLVRDGKLKRLTRDHTLAAQLLEEGVVASDDPMVDGLKNVLVQAVGGPDSELRPDVDHYELEDGDQILVCTDGLTDMVDDSVIASVLSESTSAERACRDLVDMALANGGLDNITVIVARYSIP